MTSLTNKLGLKTYNAITDGSSLVFNYINDVSGSLLESNLSIIDNWANEVSGSFAIVSASLAPTGVTSASYNIVQVDIYGRVTSGSVAPSSAGAPYDAEYLVLSPNGTLTNEKVLQNGIGTIVSSTASAASVDVNIATSLQVSTGSATEALISASSLSSSNYGKRSVVLPLNTIVPLVGNESNYVSIPSSMNGWSLVEVAASSGSSSSGSPVFLVKACPRTAISGSQNMLTTNPVIGELAYDSNAGVGSVSGVPDMSLTISTGDKIWAYSASASSCGSKVLWAQVGLTFQKIK